MPQRKQGMAVCSVMVISFPSSVFMIAFSGLAKLSIHSFLYISSYFIIAGKIGLNTEGLLRVGQKDIGLVDIIYTTEGPDEFGAAIRNLDM